LHGHRLLIVCGTAASLSILAAFSTPARGAPDARSSDEWWTRVDGTTSMDATRAPATFEVALDHLRQRLAAAPMESQGFREAVEITLPMPDGELARVRVVESPILAGDAALAHPDVHTYLAIGADDPTLRARLDVSELGVRAIAMTSRGTALLDPAEAASTDRVASTWFQDHALSAFECEVREMATSAAPAPRTTASWGSDLRTLRFILVATGEFTESAGGVPEATARMVTIMNRLNAWFERDVAVRLQVVQLVPFPDSDTDPYAFSIYSELLERNTVVVDSLFGSASYDMGAIVTKIDGIKTRGIGASPSLCNVDIKAGSVTATHDVSSLEVELTLAHELGHGLGGTHTQDRDCNRFAPTAYETGSGLTILCSMPAACVSDVQPQREPFYHVANLEQFIATLQTYAACGTTTAGVNAAPTSDAGPDVTIPRNTPFALTGSGSDADASDVLTYTWEQFDRAPTTNDPVLGPLFRWRLPTAEPLRYCPPLAALLAGVSEVYDAAPYDERVLHFRLTVRDNHPGTGGVAWDEKTVDVSGEPFIVTSPGDGEVLDSASPFMVTWDIGGGSVASNVNLRLSTDNGSTWVPLAMNTPNDGSEEVQHSTASTFTQCRIKVEAVGNIFYDMTRAFTLNFDPTPVLMLQLDAETLDEGIAIRWQLADPGRYERIVVERSDDGGAHWMEPVGERTDVAGASTFLDRSVVVGREYLYRLEATTREGEHQSFGPIAAGTRPAGLAIAAVAPNPSSGTVRIDYTVPRAAPIRVEVLDVQGRVTAVLARGSQPAGRHQIVWSGAEPRGARPGRYFIRLQSEGVTRVQSVVIAP